MPHNQTFAQGAWLCMMIACLCVGAGARPVTAEQSEILRVTVGQPTLLSVLRYQNTASLAVSRTGVVAAFYPKPRTGPRYYRTSTDGGVTWGPEMDSPPQLAGGYNSVALRDGGVLKFLCCGSAPMGEAEFHVAPMEGEFKDGWFTLHSMFAWFNDHFTSYEVAPVQVYMPDAVTTKQTHMGVSCWPIFCKGHILQLANGDLLAPMYGVFKGDTKSRVVLSRSSDGGHTWRYHATVAYEPNDPNPELPGQYNGPCEPSIALLPNGQMICVMRTQYAHPPNEYRPIYVSWSDDVGKTWTKPEPTNPHLMTISPTLAVLDNGVVACQYGRPGFHVVFSTDGGHTWRDRVSLSDLPEPLITGQFDMIKVGPNRLAAIGNDGEGTKVWPIEVERVRVSPARTKLTGRVSDQEGVPIVGAQVELGPNRYTADAWMEGPDVDRWGGHTLLNPPELAYWSIAKEKGYPTAETDARGRFEFKSVKRAEYVLTVEADGYAPQWRHINMGLDHRVYAQYFRLKAGRSVRGQVVDQTGEAVGGVCVVLDLTFLPAPYDNYRRHIHADPDGVFHWAIGAPVPDEVTVKVYKRYSGDYEVFEKRLSLAEIERQPIILRRKK